MASGAGGAGVGRAGAGRGLAGCLALLALAHAAAASTPPLIWADRNDRLFLTVPLPQMRDHAVALAPSGALAVNATSVGEAVALEIALAGPILPAESRWVAREHKLEFRTSGEWEILVQNVEQLQKLSALPTVEGMPDSTPIFKQV